MEKSASEFQTVASKILQIELPHDSTSFGLFSHAKGPDRIPKRQRTHVHNVRSDPAVNAGAIEAQYERPINKLRRSFTTIRAKGLQKVLAFSRVLKQKLANEKPKIVQANPIFFKLAAKSQPKVMQFNVKRLKNNTLVYKSDKGLLSIKPSVNEFSKKPFMYKSQDYSDQLLLSTENTLSDYYTQSIKIQNYIRRNHSEIPLKSSTYTIFSNKLQSINKNIVNEQSRIARSFYTL